MGADIHSIAEIRGKDGKWHQIMEPIFDYPYDAMYVSVTQEVAETLSDGELMDLFDFDYSTRTMQKITAKEEGYASRSRDPHGFGLDLGLKIQIYADVLSDGVNALREDHQKNRRPHSEWSKALKQLKADAASEAGGLNSAERELMILKAVNYKEQSRDEIQEDIEPLKEKYPDDYPEPIEVYVEAEFNNPYNGKQLMISRTEDDPPFMHNAPLDGRNYTLFAALGNVRNDGGVVPISEPRGVPEDASEGFKDLSRRWGVDGHSHTYHTLRQLMEYNQNEDVTYSGFISADVYEKLLEQGFGEDPYVGPESWYSSVGTATYFTIEGYEKWRSLGRPYLRQPEKISIFANEVMITPAMIPDDLTPDKAIFDAAPVFADRRPGYAELVKFATEPKIDEWKQVFQYTDDQITEAESSPFNDSRYIYHGVKPYVWVEWKAKRTEELGSDYEGMLKVFKELVSLENITPDDIRVCMVFDN